MSLETGRATVLNASSVALAEESSSVAVSANVSSRITPAIVYQFPVELAGSVMSATFGHRPRLRGIRGVSDPLQAWKLVGSSCDSPAYQLQASSSSQADRVYVAGDTAGVDELHVADSTGAYGVFRFHVSTDDVDAGLYHPASSPTVGTPQSGTVETGGKLQLTPPAPTTWTNLWSVQAWSDGQVRGYITQPWDTERPNVYHSPSVPCVELAVKWHGEEVYRNFLYVRSAGMMQAYCVPFVGHGQTLQVNVQGGTGPYTYAIVGGFGNASVSSSGVISGVVEFDVVVDVFAVRVTDSLGHSSTITIFGTPVPWDLFAVGAVVIDANTTAYLGDPTPAFWQVLELVSTTGGSTLSSDGLYQASATPGTRDHIRWTDSTGGTADLYLRVIESERMQWVQGTDKDGLVACGTRVSLVGRGGLGAPHTWSIASNASGASLLWTGISAMESAHGHTSVAFIRLRDSDGATVNLSDASVSALIRNPDGSVVDANADVQRIGADTLAVVLPHPAAIYAWESHLNLEIAIGFSAIVVSAELLFESPSETAYSAVK